jgi:hypothetical protein
LPRRHRAHDACVRLRLWFAFVQAVCGYYPRCADIVPRRAMLAGGSQPQYVHGSAQGRVLVGVPLHSEYRLARERLRSSIAHVAL